MRVCGLKGDVTHLIPPDSRLLRSKQLQQLFGISRPAITACEYYCTCPNYETFLLISNAFCRVRVSEKISHLQHLCLGMHWICRPCVTASKQKEKHCTAYIHTCPTYQCRNISETTNLGFSCRWRKGSTQMPVL